jgi:4'-phosphopantetheinyl transferase
VEKVRPIDTAEQIAQRYFSPRENAALGALPCALREAAFFDCWARKESYIKATGRGLSERLAEFDVWTDSPEPTTLVSHIAGPSNPAQWALVRLEACAGYAAALTVEGLGWQHCQWQWVEPGI